MRSNWLKIALFSFAVGAALPVHAQIGGIRDVKDKVSGVTALLATPKEKLTVSAVYIEVSQLELALAGDQPDLERVGRWSQYQKDAEEMLKKFRNVDTSQYTDKDFAVSLDQLRIAFPAMKSRIQNEFPTEGANDLTARITTLRQLLTSATTNKLGQAFTLTIPYLARTLDRKTSVYEMLVKGQKGFRPQLVEDSRGLLKELSQAQKDLSDVIIAANAVPKETFVADDKESVREAARAALIRRNPEVKILKVVLADPAWQRVEKWDWTKDAGYVEEVFSWTMATAVVEGDGGLAYLVPMRVTKNHKMKDEISAVAPEKIERPGSPELILLREKVG